MKIQIEISFGDEFDIAQAEVESEAECEAALRSFRQMGFRTTVVKDEAAKPIAVYGQRRAARRERNQIVIDLSRDFVRKVVREIEKEVRKQMP